VTDRLHDREILESPRLSLWLAHGGRARLVGVIILLLILGAIGGYIAGRVSGSHDIAEARLLNQQLQSESQRQKRQIADDNASISAVRAKLSSVQASLEAIMPADNTYNLTPNQSMIVGGGRLTIGLIGSPSNDGIILNVNGKQQLAAAGDVIKVALDAATACQVAVQSFDMFKALITASCASAGTR